MSRPTPGIAAARALLCLLLPIAPIQTARAQTASCDQSITAIPAEDGYRPRPRNGPTFCEGFYVSTVSGPALELVALVYGTPFTHPTPATKLALSTAPGSARRLRATGIPAGLYYRLDAELPQTGIFVWDAAAILAGRHIRLDQIGLFAFTSHGFGELTYAPVHVEPQPGGPTGVPGQHGRLVSAILRPLLPLDQAAWRFVDQGHKPGQWSTQDATSDRVVIQLTIADETKSGSLQVAWDDPATGVKRVKYFNLAF